MDVSSVSQTSSLYASQQLNGMQSQRQNFQALAAALQSGNLSAAQSAFAQMMQNSPIGQGTQSSTASPNQTLTTDFSNLAKALQSGNVSDAQKAFATLQQDMSSVAKTHHGHHRHHAQAASALDSTGTADTAAGGDTTGSTLNVAV